MSDREDITNAVLIEVAVERARQEAKWGEQNHAPADYLAILGEEFGEASKAVVETTFGEGSIAELREELIQTAAVAVAFVECLDREKWTTNRSAISRLTAERDEAEAIALDLIPLAADAAEKQNGDWACAECRPHSDMLKEGWSCPYHRALAFRARIATRQGGAG